MLSRAQVARKLQMSSLTYSLRCRVASEPVRWRDEGTSQRGVCFAAGCGLWGGRWRLSGTDYGGNRRPRGLVTATIDEPRGGKVKIRFHAATASCHRAAASARKVRSVGRETGRRGGVEG